MLFLWKRWANSSAWGRQIGFVLLFSALYLAWLLSNHASPRMRSVVSDSMILLGASLTLYFGVQSARPLKRRSPGVLSLNLISAAFLIGLLGWIYYSYVDIIRGVKPLFPSLTDATFLVYYLLVMSGLLVLPGGTPRAVGRIRLLLDSLMSVAALVTFSWYFLLGPILLDSGSTLPARFIGAFYPLADLALLTCLLAIASRDMPPSRRKAYSVGAIGLIICTFNDAMFGYLTLQGTYSTGHWSDVGMPLGNLLCGLSVGQLRHEFARPAFRPETEGTEERRLVLWHSLLPYALLPLVLALFLYVQAIGRRGPLETGVTIGAAALVGLLLLRQVLSILDNQRLNRSLRAAHEQMRTYAGRLEQANEELHALQEELLAGNDELASANAQLEEKTNEALSYADRVKQANEELTEMQKELVAKNHALGRANTDLEALATTDGLTGLKNHRTFQETLKTEMERAVRYSRAVSCILLDVDLFKQYNDTFGHPAGDRVLKQVAHLLQATSRSTDTVARYGGEEFVVILPDTGHDEATACAEQLRCAIAAASWPERPITASFGVATLMAAFASGTDLVSAADTALYRSKQHGRNCVTHAANPIERLAS